jgi:uncharacterized membrane protein YkvA (DUF1232 family)
VLIDVVVGLAVCLVVSWALIAVAVLVANRRLTVSLDMAALMPRTFGLLVSLARDRTLPPGLRWRLAAAIVYAGQPFNLIPDWIPVIGYADNVAVICWALRSVIRVAGPEAVAAHWKGSEESLLQLYKALRLAPPQRPAGRPLEPPPHGAGGVAAPRRAFSGRSRAGRL